MDYKEFNLRRYRQRKQLYRIMLGIEQMINHPELNLVWIMYGVGVEFFKLLCEKLLTSLTVIQIFAPILEKSMQAICIIFPIICAIGIIHFIGECIARKDEADLSLVFGDKHGTKSQPPILISKTKNKKTGVTRREFYSNIPMEQWQEKKEAICDKLSISIVNDISYGGRQKNKGNQITFESTKGRSPKERGAIYDDIL